jgi:hypothetical protein
MVEDVYVCFDEEIAAREGLTRDMIIEPVDSYR